MYKGCRRVRSLPSAYWSKFSLTARRGKVEKMREMEG